MQEVKRRKIPNPQRKDDTHYLSPDQVSFLRSQQAIIAMQRSILHALENETARTIERTFGVDLTEEVWELDLDRGELRRGTDTQ